MNIPNFQMITLIIVFTAQANPVTHMII